MPIKNIKNRRPGRPRKDAIAPTSTPSSARHHSISQDSMQLDDQDEAENSITVGGFGTAQFTGSDSPEINSSPVAISPKVADPPPVSPKASSPKPASVVTSARAISAEAVIRPKSSSPKANKPKVVATKTVNRDVGNNVAEILETEPPNGMHGKGKIVSAAKSEPPQTLAVPEAPAPVPAPTSEPSGFVAPIAPATATAGAKGLIASGANDAESDRTGLSAGGANGAEPQPDTDDGDNGIEVIGGESDDEVLPHRSSSINPHADATVNPAIRSPGANLVMSDVGHDVDHILGAVVPSAPGLEQHQPPLSYETSANLDDIVLRQLSEDVRAYQYDMDFCKSQLEEPGLTPQETRTLQLRILDLAHQIRHCSHRIETMQFQKQTAGAGSRPALGHGSSVTTSVRRPSAHPAYGAANPASAQRKANGTGYGYYMKRTGTGLLPDASTGNKRPAPSNAVDGEVSLVKRPKVTVPMTSVVMTPVGTGGALATPGEATSATPHGAHDDDTEDEDGGEANVSFVDGAQNTQLQRLGYWQCRLCTTHKYLLAGLGRLPAAPCKWPLKDISKMITHFTEMHQEHTASERCVELGDALRQNIGPLEYWLRRTRGQKITDGSIMEEIITSLQAGQMPAALRKLSRAAASMPAN